MVKWTVASALVIGFVIAGIGSGEEAPRPADGALVAFVVNATADDTDAGGCELAPAGDCTLREAIAAANLTLGMQIWFDIAECPPACTIAVDAQQLPTVTAAGTVIDGTTEPDYKGQPLVIVDGGDVISTGLFFQADDSGVAGLVVQNFTGPGVNLDFMPFSGRFLRNSIVRGSGAYGVTVTGDDTTIEGNLIEFSGGDGIGAAFVGGGTRLTIIGNTIRNNMENGVKGIRPEMVISDNVITGNGQSGLALDAGDGGELTIEGNTISGNGESGITSFGAAVVMTDNMVENNGYAGVRLAVGNPDMPAIVTGNVVRGNGAASASLLGAGTEPELLQDGIVIDTLGATVQGNTVSENAGNGISIFRDGRDSVIGGEGGAEANIITGNGLAGISVTEPEDKDDPFITGVTIAVNSISDNGTLGIDLGPTGPTDNDEGDADDGPNRLQNFPELTSAVAGSLTVAGMLDSVPERTFTIDFHLSEECDVSGFGEGAAWLGSVDVVTPAGGTTEVNFVSGKEVETGTFVTATATNLDTGDTSEFSACVEVVAEATPTPIPTETPGPTVTATPTTVPTPTATPGPSETPKQKGLAGDLDCDGDVDAVDALAALRFVAGLPPLEQMEPCDDVGSAGFAFGDLDCDGDVDAVDALAVLRFVAGLAPLAQQEPCTDVGTAG